MNTQHGDLIESVTAFDGLSSNTVNIIVHGTNCLGYMNSGFAKQLRDTYPVVFDVYKIKQKQDGLNLGDISMARISSLVLVNANTQKYCQNYRLPEGNYVDNSSVFVDYNAVYECFQKVRTWTNELVENGINVHVHFPLIGCGLANGDWNLVKAEIERALGDLPCTLWLKG